MTWGLLMYIFVLKVSKVFDLEVVMTIMLQIGHGS